MLKFRVSKNALTVLVVTPKYVRINNEHGQITVLHVMLRIPIIGGISELL